jgi:hypothetical protein
MCVVAAQHKAVHKTRQYTPWAIWNVGLAVHTQQLPVRINHGQAVEMRCAGAFKKADREYHAQLSSKFAHPGQQMLQERKVALLQPQHQLQGGRDGGRQGTGK